MFLETERLILRKFREEDFEDYCGFSLGDPERDRMMGRSPLNTVEDVRLNFNWLKDKEELKIIADSVQKIAYTIITELAESSDSAFSMLKEESEE